MEKDSGNTNDSPPDDQLVEERRKFIRLNINVQINYAVIVDSTKYATTTQNISAGGICLMTDNPLKRGDILKLDIILPEDPPTISAIGKVVWVKSFNIVTEEKTRYDVGVEFTELSEAERKRIQKYVFSVKLH